MCDWKRGAAMPDAERPKLADVVAITPREIDRAGEAFRNNPGRLPSDERSIDISDDLLKSVNDMISESSRTEEGKKDLRTTIYRVPPEIYSYDKKAYEPKAVCIGPFFFESRNEPHLESMQNYKWACVEKLISGQDLLEKCLRKMKKLEVQVRRCYSETFEQIEDSGRVRSSYYYKPLIDSDEFTLMLMLDGCFLLRLLQRYADGPENAEVDEKESKIVVGRLWIWNLVRYDLLLLQNQIPFFVIQELNELVLSNKIDLVQSAINFFGTLDPCRKQEHPKFYVPVDKVEHLLHLIYLSVLPCPQHCKSSPKQQSRKWIPSATELQLAGVEFNKRKSARGFLSFLDVKFSDGVMEIPQLDLHDYSVILYRNFIAFEQCYPDTECQITVYAAFMNFLINTEKDVRLLHLKEILINNMSVDKDATHFFGGICNEVHYARDKNYLRKLFSDVTEYHESKWHRWRAYLLREYFSNPWTIISLITGAIALFFTIFGTIFNVASR